MPAVSEKIVVRFEETGETREVKRGCRACGIHYIDWLTVANYIVSPGGIAHHGEESGMTTCGKDATKDGWWWPV